MSRPFDNRYTDALGRIYLFDGDDNVLRVAPDDAREMLASGAATMTNAAGQLALPDHRPHGKAFPRQSDTERWTYQLVANDACEEGT